MNPESGSRFSGNITRTILVTGFGPFPGAPVNPTGPLVQSLARQYLPRTKIVTHIFPTSYAAVDRDLPKLIARHRPDALLMFGLATKAATLRVETRAKNAISRLADAGGVVPAPRMIAPGRAPTLALPTPARRLLAAARLVVLSTDAGDYLCNYLCWRATLAARRSGGPKLAAFIHVPSNQGAATLRRAGQALLKETRAVLR
jgi:pyroglutamyl-peptidase